MSTNCISCVKNKRTGFDLLCDKCRLETTHGAEQPKHTPGPWMEYGNEYGDEGICKVGGMCLFDVTNKHSIGYDTTRANLRLAAASPELLEALLVALVYVEDVLDNKEQLACFKRGIVQGHVKQIRSAINKATNS